jgi:hypothetical protein
MVIAREVAKRNIIPKPQSEEVIAKEAAAMTVEKKQKIMTEEVIGKEVVVKNVKEVAVKNAKNHPVIVINRLIGTLKTNLRAVSMKNAASALKISSITPSANVATT